MPLLTLARHLPRTPTEWALCGILAVVLLGPQIYRAVVNRFRSKAAEQLLREIGFQLHATRIFPDDANFRFLNNNPLLTYTNQTIRWHAIGRLGDRIVPVVEYNSVSGYGRYRRTERTLIVATEVSVLQPEFTIQRKRWLKLDTPDHPQDPIEFGDPRFNRSLSVYAMHEGGARAVLLPDVRRELAAWDSRLWLRLYEGTLLIGRRDGMTPEVLRRVLDELDRFAHAAETQPLSA